MSKAATTATIGLASSLGDAAPDRETPGIPSARVRTIDELPLTWQHVSVLGACALGLSVDTMEMALGSVFSAVFSAPPHAVGSQRLSLLLASVYLGAIFGAPLAGWLADKFGRRRLLIVVLALLAFTSGLASVAPGFNELVAARFMSGIALGAFPPLMIVYLADTVPAQRRGTLVLVVTAVALLGPPLGIFLVKYLGEHGPADVQSWRWALLAGGVLAAFASYWCSRLPESPRWLFDRSRDAQGDAVLARFALSKPVFRPSGPRRSSDRPNASKNTLAGIAQGSIKSTQLLLAALFFLSPWSIVAFPLLSGALLIDKGIRLSDTLLFLALSTIGPIAGTLLSATVADRFDRRAALIVCAFGMLLSGSAFSMTASPLWLVATNLVFMVFAALYIPAINVYASELLPIHLRAAGVARSWAMNRVGAASAPLVLIPMLSAHGPVVMFAVIAVTIVLTIVVLLRLPAYRPYAA